MEFMDQILTSTNINSVDILMKILTNTCQYSVLSWLLDLFLALLSSCLLPAFSNLRKRKLHQNRIYDVLLIFGAIGLHL